MVQVTMSNNVKRVTEIMDANTTLRTALENVGIDYTAAGVVMSLDGAPIRPGDLDRSFSDLGVTEKCFLSGIVKMDNAA